MVNILILALFLSGVSFTISITMIFEPIRDIVSKIHPKVEELIHCPYCLSHWILFVFLLPMYGYFEPVEIVKDAYFYNFIISLFAVTSLSALFHFVHLRTYKVVTQMKMEEAMNKLHKK